LPKARLFILLAAFAAFSSLFIAGVAQAHSRPVRFDPAPGAVLDAAPSSVTGWFTSDIRSAPESFIQVLDANGSNVASTDVQLSSDRRQMSVALESGVSEGRYVVYWSTFDDADGEVFGGCYAFFIGQAAADAAVTNGETLDAATDCPAAVEEEDHTHDDEGATESNASVAVSVSVSGRDAELTILPVNFTARAPDGNTQDPNFGHYHIYLDKVPVDVLTGSHSHEEEADEEHDEETADEETTDPNGLVENPLMWAENSYTFRDLRPGVHTVTVGLTYDDHELFDPPVMASQTFVIEGDDDGGGIPAWALVVAIAGGLIVGGLGMKLAGNRG
jgi:methionine-rich copper-binding protein CopC